MRIWHKDLQTKLCDMHLQTEYREGQQIYEIVTCEKIWYNGKQYRATCNRCGTKNGGWAKCSACGKRLDGYFYHPAVREWWESSSNLWKVLRQVEQIMRERRIPHKVFMPTLMVHDTSRPIEWQTYEQQLEILQGKRKTIKRCNCDVEER